MKLERRFFQTMSLVAVYIAYRTAIFSRFTTEPLSAVVGVLSPLMVAGICWFFATGHYPLRPTERLEPKDE